MSGCFYWVWCKAPRAIFFKWYSRQEEKAAKELNVILQSPLVIGNPAFCMLFCVIMDRYGTF